MTTFLLPMKLPHLDAALADVRAKAVDARWAAAQRLGLEDGPRRAEAIGGLESLLGDPSEDVRAQAVQGLISQAENDTPIVPEHALRALGDASALVRAAGVELALLVIGEPAAVLSPLLADPEYVVRAAVASALGALEDPRSAEALQSLLADPHIMVRRQSAVALARLGDPRGEDVLLVCLPEGDEHDQTEVVLALGQIRSQKARAPLAALAGKFFGSVELKALALSALSAGGEEGAKTRLLEYLAARQHRTRLAALSALVQLPQDGVAAGVGALINARGEAEASAAIHTLQRLHEARFDEARLELEKWRGRVAGELANELEEALSASRDC